MVVGEAGIRRSVGWSAGSLVRSLALAAAVGREIGEQSKPSCAILGCWCSAEARPTVCMYVVCTYITYGVHVYRIISVYCDD